jgi:hypothetical protein
MITDRDSAFIFAAMKRGDYLPFAERNMREEFSSTEHAQAEKRRYDSRQARGAADPEAQRNRTEVQVLSAPPLRQICAWCPTFDKHDPANKGASHTICPACAKRMEEQS